MLKKDDINSLYQYLLRNSKVVIFFILVVMVHVYLAFNLQAKGKQVLARLDLQKHHQVGASAISKNLMSDCEVFKSNASLNRLEKFFEKKNIIPELSRKLILSLDKLEFYEVSLKTVKDSLENSDYNIQTQSIGYMVEHKQNKNCFGTL